MIQDMTHDETDGASPSHAWFVRPGAQGKDEAVTETLSCGSLTAKEVKWPIS